MCSPFSLLSVAGEDEGGGQTRWPAGFQRRRRRVWVLNSFFLKKNFPQISSPSSPLSEFQLEILKTSLKRPRSTCLVFFLREKWNRLKPLPCFEKEIDLAKWKTSTLPSPVLVRIWVPKMVEVRIWVPKMVEVRIWTIIVVVRSKTWAVVVLLERTDLNNERFLWVMSLNVHSVLIFVHIILVDFLWFDSGEHEKDGN